jgi:hypothetical protein
MNHRWFPGLGVCAWLRVLFACVLGAASLDAGVVRTFTSRDGRTIEAEWLGYRGDTLRLRRVDTDKEFSLALGNLSTADQKEVRELMEKHPELREVITKDALRVETSRTKLKMKDKRILNDTQELEAWAYDLTITNLTNYPIPSLRVEYVIAGEGERANGGGTSSERVVRHKGSLVVDILPGRERKTLRTEPLICVTRLEFRSGYVNGIWVTDYSKPARRVKERSLRGIWFRIYDGQTLIVEQAMPEGLLREDWDAVDREMDSWKQDFRVSEFFSDPKA